MIARVVAINRAYTSPGIAPSARSLRNPPWSHVPSSRIAPGGWLLFGVHPSADILAPPAAVGYLVTSDPPLRGPAADPRPRALRRLMARSKSPTSSFRDRRDAGRHLARALARYARRPDVVVLAL